MALNRKLLPTLMIPLTFNETFTKKVFPTACFPLSSLSRFPTFPLSCFHTCFYTPYYQASHFPTFFTFPLSHFPAFLLSYLLLHSLLSSFPLSHFLYFPAFPLSLFPAFCFQTSCFQHSLLSSFPLYDSCFLFSSYIFNCQL